VTVDSELVWNSINSVSILVKSVSPVEHLHLYSIKILHCFLKISNVQRFWGKPLFCCCNNIWESFQILHLWVLSYFKIILMLIQSEWIGILLKCSNATEHDISWIPKSAVSHLTHSSEHSDQRRTLEWKLTANSAACFLQKQVYFIQTLDIPVEHPPMTKPANTVVHEQSTIHWSSDVNLPIFNC
jgi:hypothetical protein